jgi:hypothetical protein
MPEILQPWGSEAGSQDSEEFTIAKRGVELLGGVGLSKRWDRGQGCIAPKHDVAEPRPHF